MTSTSYYISYYIRIYRFHFIKKNLLFTISIFQKKFLHIFYPFKDGRFSSSFGLIFATPAVKFIYRPIYGFASSGNRIHPLTGGNYFQTESKGPSSITPTARLCPSFSDCLFTVFRYFESIKFRTKILEDLRNAESAGRVRNRLHFVRWVQFIRYDAQSVRARRYNNSSGSFLEYSMLNSNWNITYFMYSKFLEALRSYESDFLG